MAAVALNKFRSIRVGITTEMVGIYTCPIGVASIVILSQVTNVSTGASAGSYKVTAVHSRSSESPSDYKFANEVLIPANDGINLIADGRMALETNDVIKIKADSNNKLELILSVLETAKQ
jgi:hypothetical protein